MDYIVESGLGFRKWESGLFEQWGTHEYRDGVTTATGPLYTSGNFLINYNESFLGNPEQFIATLRRTDRFGFVNARYYGPSGATVAVTMTATYGANFPLYVEWYAIGRWK